MKMFKKSLISMTAVAAMFVSMAAFAVKPSERYTIVDATIDINLATATEETPGEFSTLLLALSLYPGIIDVLDGNGQYTVFAPTDDAFANLEEILPLFCYTEGLVPFVLDNPDYIEDVLLYHVAKGRMDAASVLPKDQIRMLSGGFVTREPGSLEIVDQLGRVSTLLAVDQPSDTPADNGVIHVISEVLLPYPPASICP